METDNDDSAKTCWVCYGSDQDEPSASWVQPCKCRGSTRFVHVKCLERWIDEIQNFDTSIKVSCRVCDTEYIIIYPNPGAFHRLLDISDSFILKSCPFIVGVMALGSVYWTAVTYGAITTFQVLGHKESLHLMEQTDSVILFIALPMVPVMLVMFNMICWEDYIFRLGLRYSHKVPFLHCFLPKTSSGLSSLSYLEDVNDSMQQNYPLRTSSYTVPRIVCGAFILPTLATIFGKIFYSKVMSNGKRAFFGGVTFVGMRGILRLYHLIVKWKRTSKRVIQDYCA